MGMYVAAVATLGSLAFVALTHADGAGALATRLGGGLSALTRGRQFAREGGARAPGAVTPPRGRASHTLLATSHNSIPVDTRGSRMT